MPWDSDNLSVEEYSDVTKKLGPYISCNPRERKSALSPKSRLELNNKRKKKIVLITDDAYYNRKAVSEMLNRLNIQTMEAINGEDAVAKVKKSFYRDSDFKVQLILMDLEMPIMGGIEATIEIRKLEKAYGKNNKIPIVAITAHSSINHKNGCLKAGMQEHIVKPASSKILKGILEKYAAELLEEAIVESHVE